MYCTRLNPLYVCSVYSLRLAYVMHAYWFISLCIQGMCQLHYGWGKGGEGSSCNEGPPCWYPYSSSRCDQVWDVHAYSEEVCLYPLLTPLWSVQEAKTQHCVRREPIICRWFIGMFHACILCHGCHGGAFYNLKTLYTVYFSFRFYTHVETHKQYLAYMYM